MGEEAHDLDNAISLQLLIKLSMVHLITGKKMVVKY